MIAVLFNTLTFDFVNTIINIKPINATIAGIAVAGPCVKLVNATAVY